MTVVTVVVTVLIVGQVLSGTWMGVDQAAYLLTLSEPLGGDSIEAWFRPTLAPGLLLWPFVAKWGDRLGLIVFGSVLTALVVCAGYFYARSHDLSPRAIAAATGLEPVMSGTTIGGPIILTPIALILFGVGLVMRIDRGDNIPSPVFLVFGIVPWLNQTYAVIAPTALLVIALGKSGVLRRLTKRHLIACAGAVLIATPALFWYADVAAWSNHMSGGMALELLPLAVNPAVVLFYPALCLRPLPGYARTSGRRGRPEHLLGVRHPRGALEPDLQADVPGHSAHAPGGRQDRDVAAVELPGHEKGALRPDFRRVDGPFPSGRV